MKNKILILSELDDAHSLAVQHLCKKEFNVDAVIIDTALFPVKHRISMALQNNDVDISIKTESEEHHLNSFSSIWWRRPQTPRISMTDADISGFCKEASRMLISGSLYASGIKIVNHPSSQARAEQKPFQLSAAQALGIRCPISMITNDSVDAINFIRSVPECVMKSFSPFIGNMVKARLVTANDIKSEGLRVSPAIFQEKIEGDDLRINVFGDEVFAAKAERLLSSNEIDWRTDVSTNWRTIELSKENSSTIVNLVKSLGLDYGCIDMKLTPDNELVFLEINPSGQFIFIEVHTKQPLVRQMCQLLLL